MSDKNEKLKIALLNIHGLIRGHDLELGRDADTGGQTLYVLELAQALSEQEKVGEVLLITRRVEDDEVSPAATKVIKLSYDDWIYIYAHVSSLC